MGISALESLHRRPTHRQEDRKPRAGRQDTSEGGEMTTTKERIKRRGDIRMKVAEDIEERLDRISKVYGMPPSTLAAMAVGQWIAQQERALMMTEAISNAVGQSMGDAVATELRQQLSLLTLAKDGGGDD